MRIISIGCPVPSPSVDNHSIANAPSIFDYDACIIDLQSVSEQIEGIAASTLDVRAPDGRAITQENLEPFTTGWLSCSTSGRWSFASCSIVEAC